MRDKQSLPEYGKRSLPAEPVLTGPMYWLSLAVLLAGAVLSALVPYDYFFDESILFTGLFLMLLLGLHGPVACCVGAVLSYGAAWLLVTPDLLQLLRPMQFLIVSVLYVLLKRRMLLAQALFTLGVAVPFSAATRLFKLADDSKAISLILARDLVHALFEAIFIEALLIIGLPLLRRVWRSIRSANPRLFKQTAQTTRNVDGAETHVRIRMRNLLVHATFGPLLLCAMLLLVSAGSTSMREIVRNTRTLTDTMVSGMQRELEGWTDAERRSLALEGMIETAKLEDAFRSVARDISSKLVLLRADGSEQLHVHAGDEYLLVNMNSASAMDLGNGLHLLTWHPVGSSFRRAWQDGVFVRAFTLERQVALVALPLREVDDIIDLQYRMMQTTGPFLLLALGLLLLISSLLVRSLNHLAEGTTGLLMRLGAGSRPRIPSSGIMEIDALAENFRVMNGTLDDLFQELQTANEDLVAQSERLRRSEAEMFRLAHFDVLTQLPNRFYLRKTLNDLIDARRPFSLLLVDLDRFKPINDQHGHHVGDLVLQEVGQAFRDVIGDSGEQGMFACRLGGDEFVAVVADQSPDAVRELAKRLIDRVAAPIHVAGITAQVLASVGISRHPEHGTDSGILLKQADQAMYHAKQLGGNAFAEGGDPDA